MPITFTTVYIKNEILSYMLTKWDLYVHGSRSAVEHIFGMWQTYLFRMYASNVKCVYIWHLCVSSMGNKSCSFLLAQLMSKGSQFCMVLLL